MKTETWIRIYDILEKICACIIGSALIFTGITDSNNQWLIAVGFYVFSKINYENITKNITK
jgi:hypothetical protein